MNTIELNEDQIRRIEARLNLLHMEMRETYFHDIEAYNFALGRTKGICMMLDEIGYDSVYDEKKERMYLRRAQSDGRK